MAGSEDSGRQILHPVLNGLFIAFSMYSRIPTPRFQWEERDMRYTFCFFPGLERLSGSVCMAGIVCVTGAGSGWCAGRQWTERFLC